MGVDQIGMIFTIHISRPNGNESWIGRRLSGTLGCPRPIFQNLVDSLILPLEGLFSFQKNFLTL